MSAILLHDAFVGSACEGQARAQPAVSIEAGAIWGRVYQEVMVKAGRYVQGGGCLTVGVGGFVNGGGFGSLSKAFGTAAANLIEAEVVTADGDVKLANACLNADLFWAIKGGGSGFGVVTRMTLRTHELPEVIGAVRATIDAASDDAYRRLVAKAFDFYAQALFNPQWGEQFRLQRGRRLWIQMVFQGLGRDEAEAAWRPFFDWVAASPAGLQRRFAASDSGRAGPQVLGPRDAQANSWRRPFRRSRRARRRATSFGAGISTRPVRSSMPINRCGCRRLSLTSTSARASSRR